jgi:hypothetical protein
VQADLLSEHEAAVPVPVPGQVQVYALVPFTLFVLAVVEGIHPFRVVVEHCPSEFVVFATQVFDVLFHV